MQNDEPGEQGDGGDPEMNVGENLSPHFSGRIGLVHFVQADFS